jgi:hypothetical protein
MNLLEKLTQPLAFTYGLLCGIVVGIGFMFSLGFGIIKLITGNE